MQTNVSLLYQLVGKPETYSLYLSIQQMFGVMFNRLWDLRLNNGSWNHAELFFKFHHCKTISYCVYHIRGEINSWCIIILVCQYTLFAITEGGSGCMEQDSEDLTKLDISVQMGLLQGTFTTELYEQHSEPSIVLCDLSIISKIEINKWNLRLRHII